MDLECLQHCLTEDERTKFERDGFLVVENALPDTMIADLIQAVDRVKPGDGGLGRDDLFLELVDWPTTFPKVFGILGWNIYVYYTQILITPPLNEEQRANANNERRFWHQDSDRVNADIEPGATAAPLGKSRIFPDRSHGRRAWQLHHYPWQSSQARTGLPA